MLTLDFVCRGRCLHGEVADLSVSVVPLMDCCPRAGGAGVSVVPLMDSCLRAGRTGGEGSSVSSNGGVERCPARGGGSLLRLRGPSLGLLSSGRGGRSLRGPSYGWLSSGRGGRRGGDRGFGSSRPKSSKIWYRLGLFYLLKTNLVTYSLTDLRTAGSY